MGAPNLPGDLVSEQLPADCTRFLEELRVLVGRRRAAMLGPKTGWLPDPPRDGDVDAPQR